MFRTSISFASDILSDIALAKPANGGKLMPTDAKASSAESADMRTLRESGSISREFSESIVKNPTLSAKFNHVKPL